MADRTPLSERTSEHRKGAALLAIGALLCFTLIGGILGLPMIAVGYWYWKKGDRIEAEGETEPPPDAPAETAE